jgi:hypothetical protein
MLKIEVILKIGKMSQITEVVNSETGRRRRRRFVLPRPGATSSHLVKMFGRS